MNHEVFWPRLKSAFGNQKIFWASHEIAEKPGVTDRLLHYLISYYESPAVARKAVRIFRGITLEFNTPTFCGWNEVRVATLREIDDALQRAGAKATSWELAITIKDFLENLWQTLDTLNLNQVMETNPGDIAGYLRQLRGIPNSWFAVPEKGKPVPLDTPVRSKQSNFYKHLKRYRKPDEPVLPSCAIDYLEYLWKRTSRAPFEHHANRIMARLGLFAPNAPMTTKITQFEAFTTERTPITKHKHLVQLGKVVCLAKTPRCEICPVRDMCSKNGVN